VLSRKIEKVVRKTSPGEENIGFNFTCLSSATKNFNNKTNQLAISHK